ncbi:MAG: membrane bound O-acyl transferase family-domain-containing protein [Candidatus Obscuribacterales bacterium]|nr:membrane bound O-acyl transferase family-domain-containing protein [Candidatus Obscuribacterales bacterium]
MFILVCLCLWLTNSLLAVRTPNGLRRPAGFVWPALISLLLVWQADLLLPWQRLLTTSVGLLFVIKAVVLLSKFSKDELAQTPKLGLLLYLSLWPGVDPLPLLSSTAPVVEDGRRFARGLHYMLGGLITAVSTAAFLPFFGTIAGWLGLASLLMIVHFGYADMLTTLMRLAGWNVNPLFNEPLKSTSLRDFWSKRWNLAFVEMDKILFFDWLKKRFGAKGAVFGVFVVSGILHDFCISYSAGGGWGWPTLYFIVQGLAVLLESRFIKRSTPKIISRLWTWAWLLLPLPWLFTPQFRGIFIVPLFQSLHGIFAINDLSWYLSSALWVAAAGHFGTTAAGLQVPYRLNWKDELSRVSPFNRKIFLNYAAYVGLIILAFGGGSLWLHDEIMRGEKAALFLCGLISCFWALRLAVDYFWFGEEDWPKGPLFVIGHACLNMLFLFMTTVYTAIVFWHWLS